MSIKELDYSTVKEANDLDEKNLKNSLKEVFDIIDKKHYHNAQDKKTFELIKNSLDYIEGTRIRRDKILDDWRYAWESYWMKDEQEKHQYETFLSKVILRHQ